MKKTLLLLTALSFVGCASFKTTQTDERLNEKTGEKTTVTTVVKARTFFDAKSELAKFKADQSDAKQSATVGSLKSETSGTNAVNVLKIVVEGAVSGAAKAVVP